MWYVWVLIPAALFGLAGLTGAPYLPVRKRHLVEVFEALNLKPGQRLLELGCGDGTILIEAARRGVASVGYEINPIMFGIAWVRCLKYRKLTQVRLGNMWAGDWPPCDAVYTFLIPRLMPKLDVALRVYARRPIRLVSYTFPIDGKTPVKTTKNCFVYSYEASANRP